MESTYIHIVTPTIPYPPNFGGVIDVFYRIKALHEAGAKIILHCFEYDREKSAELEILCEKVFYYKRNTGILSNISMLPYIVLSRKNKHLLKNLCNDNYPILFEGLHCCYYLGNRQLKNRLKLYRSANIEHYYYWNLFKAEKSNLIKIVYYLIESFRLKLYEKTVKNAGVIFPISLKETGYFKKRFPENNVVFLPAFHGNGELTSREGRGKYIMYHGNLSVEENESAAVFLIRQVFSELTFPFVIAGLNPSVRLKKLVAKYPHISLIDSPPQKEMDDLIQNAHVHILVTFQATGLKLKLLNVLYKGRFCLANNKMLEGSGLDCLCEKANTPQEIKKKIHFLMKEDFSLREIEKRKEVLLEKYSNCRNIQLLTGFFLK
jgi:hypothetical protein